MQPLPRTIDALLKLAARIIDCRAYQLADALRSVGAFRSLPGPCFGPRQSRRFCRARVLDRSQCQTGQQIVQRQLNIQPTLTIRPGFPVRVIVTHDLVLAPYGQGGKP